MSQGQVGAWKEAAGKKRCGVEMLPFVTSGGHYAALCPPYGQVGCYVETMSQGTIDLCETAWRKKSGGDEPRRSYGHGRVNYGLPAGVITICALGFNWPTR